MRRLAAPLVLTLSLSFVSAGHAAEPKVTLEATLDVAPEVPAPKGTLPGAGGSAILEYDETGKSITYVVTVMNLTGPPIAAHIHQAGPGMAGPVRITLDQNQLGGGAPALPVPDDLVEPLFDGGTYVNILTAANPDGEVRGQIHLKATACSCNGSPRALRQCVRQAIEALAKSERRSPAIRALWRDVKTSSCGRTKGPKNAVACCVRQAAGNIVNDALCLSVPEKACRKRGGASLGPGTSCFPSNPCKPPA
jgi:hypothetical protein